MKLTPSTTYLALARGAAKEYRWRFYHRVVESLGVALSSGSWTEVTSMVDEDSWSTVRTGIEMSVAKYKGDAITLTASDVGYWRALLEKEYVEFKVELQLIGASDVLPIFCGFVDLRTPPDYNIMTDRVSFSVISAVEFGERLSAELIVEFPRTTNIGGSGNTGVPLNDPVRSSAASTGTYVTNGAISGYELLPGVHVLEYDYNSGTRRMRLDGGEWRTTNSTGLFTLSNPGDTERIQIYVGATGPTTNWTENVIVTEFNQQYPGRWYRETPSRTLITKCFGTLGLSVTFDDIEMPTFDDSKRLQIVNQPKASGIFAPASSITAVASGSTGGDCIYMAVGPKILRYDVKQGVYTELFSVSGTGDPVLIIPAEARDHLWVFQTFAQKVYRHTLSTGSTSSVTIDSNGDMNNQWTSMLVEDNSYNYAFLYVDYVSNNGRLRQIDGSSMSVSTIFTGNDFSYTGGGGRGLQTRGLLFAEDAFTFWVPVVNNDPKRAYRRLRQNFGFWQDLGEELTGVDEYEVGAYHPIEERVYYVETTTGLSPTGNINFHDLISMNGNTVYNGDQFQSNFRMHYSAGTEKVWMWWDGGAFGGNVNNLLSIDSSGCTIEWTKELNSYGHVTSVGDRIWTTLDQTRTGYGITDHLAQFSNRIIPIIEKAKFTGMYVTEALYKVLAASVLVSNISATKSAYVFRRFTAAGTPQTTGNVLSVTVSDPDQVRSVDRYSSAVGVMIISNGETTVSYDGTNYRVWTSKLSNTAAVFSDVRRFELSNDYIHPLTVKDLAYYLWGFFSRDWDMVHLRLANQPLFQFEPIDGCSVDLTSLPLGIVKSGTIYDCGYGKNTDFDVSVLVPHD